MAHAMPRKSLAMGPSVRSLLSRYNLDPRQIQSTGPHQTLLKGDVLSYLSQHVQPQSVQKTAPPQGAKARVFTPELDLSGYQPKKGPEGFSKIAKQLLGD